MEKIIFVYVTVANFSEARTLSTKILKKRLAACVNIIHPITSLYIWKGAIEKNTETSLIIKTRKSFFKKLARFIKKAHSYSCPCIASFPVQDLERGYNRWLAEETSTQISKKGYTRSIP